MRAVPSRFDALLKSIPTLNEVPSVTARSPRPPLFENPSFLYRITVLDGKLQPALPWVTQLSIQISSRLLGYMGSTVPKRQAQRVEWNESIFAIFQPACPEIQIGLIHHIENRKENLFGVGSLNLAALGQSGSIEAEVRMNQYGTIRIICEVMPADVSVLSDAVHTMARFQERRFISLFVDQVLPIPNQAFIRFSRPHSSNHSQIQDQRF